MMLKRTPLMKRLALRLMLLVPLAVAFPAHAGHWFPCGDITQIGWSCQLASYPSTQYEYGIAYNSSEPQVVNCLYWNYGRRITNRHPYLTFSDNPSLPMHWGGFMFYTGTQASDDPICSGGTWRHRYWWMGANNVVSTGYGNGCVGSAIVLYCRTRSGTGS
jgi:hypothetical protein